MSTDTSASPATVNAERRFPPVIPVVSFSLTCVVIGGIVMASYAPRKPPLGLPIALLVAAALTLLGGIGMLVRHPGFRWDMFGRVGRWALLAYLVSAGMIEFAFVKNHTRGAQLGIVTGMLVIFALSVPTLIATTVARYADA